jgi:hypothetical protein
MLLADKQARDHERDQDSLSTFKKQQEDLMISRLVLSFLCLTFILDIHSSSTARAGEGTFIEVEDGTKHECIDVTKYDVSMMLVSLQAKRTRTFWKESKSLGSRFDVTILNSDGKDFTFPRGVMLDATDIVHDVALLPIRFPLMSKYSLTGDKPYSNITLTFYVVNVEQLNAVTNAVSEFIDFSKSLPLPPSPYIQGVQHFADFAIKIFKDNLKTVEDAQPVAAFSFDLASTDEDVGACPATALRNGIHAAIFSGDSSEEGVISVSDASKYCYFIEPTSGQIMYDVKSSSGCSVAISHKPLRNPLVAFFATRWSKPGAQTNLSSVVGLFNGGKIEQRGPGLTRSNVELALSKVRQTYGTAASTENVIEIDRALRSSSPERMSNLAQAEKSAGAEQIRAAETTLSLYLCGVAGVSLALCQ